MHSFAIKVRAANADGLNFVGYNAVGMKELQQLSLGQCNLTVKLTEFFCKEKSTHQTEI